MHSASTRYRGGNLDAYLDYTMNYGGETMESSVFYLSQTVFYQFTDSESMEDLVRHGRKPKTRTWN